MKFSTLHEKESQLKTKIRKRSIERFAIRKVQAKDRMVLGENVSRLFSVNELPKRITDCCIAEKRGARVAKFGFPPGQFRPVIFIREECNARHSDMRNGIGCALE